MTDETRTLEQTISRIVELARTTLEAQTSLAKQSVELGRATLTSEIDPLTAGRVWLEAVSREGSRYWDEAGALGLDLVGRLVTLGARSMSRVMSETEQASKPGATGAQGPTAATPAAADGTSTTTASTSKSTRRPRRATTDGVVS